MTTFLKCHSCKCAIRIPYVWEDIPKPMYWKWKDKTKMTRVHVCEKCWSRARSLKA